MRSLVIQSRKRILLAGLLVLAPVFTACERVDQISSIDTSFNVAAKKRSATIVYANVSASGVAQGLAKPGKGVTLNVGQYSLVVPKGAVLRPTQFRMTVLPGSLVQVQLEAWDANTGQNVTQFPRGLQLTLPLSALSSYAMDEECKFVLANISEDGLHTILEVVDANIDSNTNTVTGKITHFSIWAVAKEIIVGID